MPDADSFPASGHTVQFSQNQLSLLFIKDNQSQCSTLVRNSVVRANLQGYGKWWISTPWGAETVEPIEMKLYVRDPTPHAQDEKCT